MIQNTNNDNQQSQKAKGWEFKFFGHKPETPQVQNFSNSGKSFPLAMSSVGECMAIVKLKGTEGTVRRLISMGLVPGTELKIINIANGSIIVALGDNRIGLGAGLAQKIICTNV